MTAVLNQTCQEEKEFIWTKRAERGARNLERARGMAELGSSSTPDPPRQRGRFTRKSVVKFRKVFEKLRFRRFLRSAFSVAEKRLRHAVTEFAQKRPPQLAQSAPDERFTYDEGEEFGQLTERPKRSSSRNGGGRRRKNG